MSQQSKHAVAYLRVSGSSQEDGDGFDRQLEAIQRYCTANGIELLKIYRETLTGGSDTLERIALMEIFDDCKDMKEKPVIVIERLDRLAREIRTQENILRDAEKRGISIISSLEPDLCSKDPSRKAMRQMMGVFAELDRDMIVAKLRSAKVRKQTKAEQLGLPKPRTDGPAPYGELPGEIGVISRMRELRDTGKSFDAVADALSMEGIPTRNGGVWRGRVINRILSRAVSA